LIAAKTLILFETSWRNADSLFYSNQNSPRAAT
jgi:hypothetical protein